MVLVFAETQKGHLKKAAFEAVTYGEKTRRLAWLEMRGRRARLQRVGCGQSWKIRRRPVVLAVADAALNDFDSQRYAAVLSDLAKKEGAMTVVLAHSSTGKSLAGRLAVRLDAGFVSGVNSLPVVEGGNFRVKKSVLSGKAIGQYQISSPVKVLSPHGRRRKTGGIGSPAAIENVSVGIPASRIRVKEVKTQEGTVPLPEAEIVVSAGRGMKGPENWGIGGRPPKPSARRRPARVRWPTRLAAPPRRARRANGHRHPPKFVRGNWHFGGHPAFGRREQLEVHRRHQQRPRGSVF